MRLRGMALAATLLTIANPHTTSAPPSVDMTSWRLAPGVFVDYASWEGVPLSALLAKAKANGQVLPPEHGYPVRLVAEEF